MPVMLRLLCLVPFLAVLASPARAASEPFDLTGPGLQVAVTHGGRTLPIARVPNLAEGDRVSIKLELPRRQGAKMLLVGAFLRGATNPPPKDWFFKTETWEEDGNKLSLVVPKGARQLVLLLAPEENSDFDAIVEAVRDRPGTFVRASQELNQASLDRARLDAFLGAMRRLEQTRPEAIAAISPVLTRSLSVKLNTDCLSQPTDLQAQCLTQDREALLLADTHTSALAETLAGASTDLAYQLSATPKAGFGYYSPYIGVVRDIARLFGAFESTQLQYIPALSRIDDDRVTLLLNSPPSFGRPTSVMVVALPAIEPPRFPPLRLPSAEPALCAAPGTVLPVEGAPLIYATHYAQNMRVRIAKSGDSLDLAVAADPERGGYVLSAPATTYEGLGASFAAQLHGEWGFTPFVGPNFRLANPNAGTWAPASPDAAMLLVGRDNALALTGAAPACIDRITLGENGRALAWKATGTHAIAVTVPLAPAEPDTLALFVHPKGGGEPDRIALTTTTEPLRLDRFTLHAGDAEGVLVGTALDKVTSLELGDLVFEPGTIARAEGTDRLTLAAKDAKAAAALPAGRSAKATVTLAGGRTRVLPVTIAAPRPAATLIGLTTRTTRQEGRLPITLADEHVVPLGAPLTFSFRAAPGTRLTGHETIEIVTADGRLSTRITPGAGYAIQNDRIGVVTADFAEALGPSAFGPLRFRIVQNGVEGAWAPLATLVRLPTLTGWRCDANACTLTGADLYLVEAIATDPGFTGPIAVPDGFTGTSITLPKPPGDALYLHLSDDPKATATVALK